MKKLMVPSNFVNGPGLPAHICKLPGIKGLASITKGKIRHVMDLNHQAVDSYCSRSSCKGNHLIPISCGMARINYHRQMAFPPDHGNG
jgi:hypothetical protein